MISLVRTNERRQPVRLPPRMKTGTPYSFRARRTEAPPSAWWLPRCLQTGPWTGQGLRELPRNVEPWMFLAGAAACILLTFLLRISGSAFATSPPTEVARANDGQAEIAIPAKTDPLKGLRRPELTPVAQLQRKKLRTIAMEEVEALNAGKQPVRSPIEPLPGHNLALGGPNPLLGQNPRDNQQEEYTQDPLTGAWFNANNLWQVRDNYSLPIDGNEVKTARSRLAQIGVKPAIEMQWWSPRTADVHEKHWKGKIAKLRFLAVLLPAEIQRAEDHVRIVQTRGCTPDGRVLVEAEALFYSPTWNLVSTEVKAKPNWFPSGKMTIKKGDAGKLPVRGREIELVRKAVHHEEEDAPIREVKWWAPRLNRFVRHRMSKLRYEVNRDGSVRLEEIVFDYNQKRATLAQLPTNLFPEYDRRTLRLEQAQR